MKISIKLLAFLCANCIAISIGTYAAAADGSEAAVLPAIITAEEFDAISAHTAYAARIMLPRANSTGTSGNSCGAFVADEPNVSFSVISAPAAETYNVQLFHGTISGGGTPVLLYGKNVPIASGACFSDLVIGESYFFKISSSDAPASGSNAGYSYKTYAAAADKGE